MAANRFIARYGLDGSTINNGNSISNISKELIVDESDGVSIDYAKSVDRFDDSGILNVSLGGTGVNSLSGILKGSGTSPVSTAIPDVDYVTPTGNVNSVSKFKDARVINGVLFDGSTNIQIPLRSIELKPGTVFESNRYGKSPYLYDSLLGANSVKVRFINNQFIILNNSNYITRISPDGTSYLSTASAIDFFKDITFGLGTYVAISSSKIYTSTDLTNWTQQYHAGGILYSINFNGSVFTVGTDTNNRISSTNLTTWSLDPIAGMAGTNPKVKYITNIGQTIIAANDASSLFKSTDSINWTNAAPSDMGLLKITGIKNIEEVTYLLLENGKIQFSSNPSTSTWQTLSIIDKCVPVDIIKLGDVYFVLDIYNKFFIGFPDGSSITWKEIKNGYDNINIAVNMEGYNGLGIIVGGLGKVYKFDMNSFKDQLDGVIRLDGKKVLKSSYPALVTTNIYNGMTVMSSGLGYNQIAHSLTGNMMDIVYGSGKYILAKSTTSMYSYDLKNWHPVTGITSGIQLNTVIYENGIFISGGTLGYMGKSTDGINWAVLDGGFGSNNVQSITYGNGMFVAVGLSGLLATSPDGDIWTQRDSKFGTSIIESVSYGNGVFIAVGQSGKVSRSTDGINWVLSSTTIGSYAGSVHYSTWDGKWRVLSNGILGLSSDNGNTWSNKTIPIVSGYYKSVINLQGKTIFVAGRGRVFLSYDDTNWSDLYTDFNLNDNMYTIKRIFDKVFILGSNGKVIVSTYDILLELPDLTAQGDFFVIPN